MHDLWKDKLSTEDSETSFKDCHPSYTEQDSIFDSQGQLFNGIALASLL